MPHRIEQFAALLLDRRAVRGDALAEGAKRDFGARQRSFAVLEFAREGIQVAHCLFQFAGDLFGAVGKLLLLLLEAQVVGIELAPAGRLMPHRRFKPGDRLAVFGFTALRVPEPIFGLGQLPLGRALLHFAIVGLGRLLLDFDEQLTPLIVELFELKVEMAVVIGCRSDAQVAQFLRVFAEFGGFRGLAADGIQLRLDLAHDVGQPQQVLGYPLQLPLGIDLSGFETADARGFFEHLAAIDVGGLQELIDATLFDDAVRRRSGSRPQKQIANVLEPRRRAIDQIFRLAGTIDAAADLHVVGVEREHTPGVVKIEQGLGKLGGFAVGRAVEDDVGHLLSAKTFGALVAENPLDRIDDVALARAVGPDHAGDARREIKTGAVGEALEAE